MSKNIEKSIYNVIFKIIVFVTMLGSSALTLAVSPPASPVVPTGESNISRKDPVQFLHSITDRVLTELKHYKGHYKEDGQHKTNEEIYKIVDNFILPNVDFDEMCKWIAGRGNWSKAIDSERNEFIHELKKLLTKTYSSTLSNYSEEKIEFQNYKGDLGAKRIQVKSTVVRPNKDNLSVDYRLIATEDSWKVYDLIIEGVSILQGFRAQFSDDIRMHGLKMVSAKIKNHNEQKFNDSKSK